MLNFLAHILGVRGFDSRRGLLIILFSTASRPALGPTQGSYSMGTGGSFPGLKRPLREADHSPPSSSEIKNAWRYTTTPQYVFMAWCLVKHRDKFTFIFIVQNASICWRIVFMVTFT